MEINRILDRVVIERSMLIKTMLDDLGDESISPTNAIPIPNVRVVAFLPCQSSSTDLILRQVNEAVLRKVIEWCEHHRNDPPQAQDDESDGRRRTTDIEEWDQKFMQVDQEMLFEIILVCVPLGSSVFYTEKKKVQRDNLTRSLNRRQTTSTSSLFSMSAAKLWPT